ncbi:protein CcmA, bactofilin family [Mucilaginibacter mallensis]|uniref:Protein CcmA, bactofilin family n=1 Tax=Mucilaginibacter mallensis TaxID=652787 RepID=A0A1H2BYT9_MUCMA|nr:polymer-forming cytoskeletal protein [Mucilaginibacter mallensis]SDT62926.1 protein CcmA, bactofilin family [Mucilaginibacter mallensis]
MSIFSKKDKVSLDMQSISTLISEGCIFDGNLKAPAYARIDGQITGDVMVDEGLIIGEKGSIQGNVITKEMVVYGTVNGNLQVNSLEIKASGKISGEIRTQTLEVENGAVYNGSLSMTQNNKLAQSNQTAASTKVKPKLIEVG